MELDFAIIIRGIGACQQRETENVIPPNKRKSIKNALRAKN